MARRDDKRRRRVKIFMGMITIFIMISSGLAIFADNINSNVVKYGKYKFRQVQEGNFNLWQTKVSGQEMTFFVHPIDIESVPVSSELASLLRDSDAIYVTSDMNSTITEPIMRAQYVFGMKVYSLFKKNVLFGQLVQTEKDFPVIGCENATKSMPVIIFEEGEFGISSEGYCAKVSAQSEYDFYALTDRLLFSILGIIP